jgi:hypothetical protein
MRPPNDYIILVITYDTDKAYATNAALMLREMQNLFCAGFQKDNAEGTEGTEGERCGKLNLKI